MHCGSLRVVERFDFAGCRVKASICIAVTGNSARINCYSFQGNSMNAFLTGSRIYGTPSENSDIDLVVLMNQTEIEMLSSKFPIRFEKLNIIAVNNAHEFSLWKEAMELCVNEMPVSRDRAIEIHKAVGVIAGEVSKTKQQLIAEGLM